MQGSGYASCHAIFLVLTHEMQETHELSFGPQQRNVCLTGSLRLIGVYIYGIPDSHTK